MVAVLQKPCSTSYHMTINSLLQLFSPPDDPSLINYGTYSPSLVALSILVAIFSSWMALQVVSLAHASTSRGRALRIVCLLYTSPSPRDGLLSRMPSSA